MAMVLQDFDYPALADTAMAAFLQHSYEYLAQRLKLLEPDLDLFEMAAGYRIGGGAAGLGQIG